MGYSYDYFDQWSRANQRPYNHVHATDSGMVTSEDIARKNIRALGGSLGDGSDTRNHDNTLTDTLRWLAKRNMVSAGVRERIERLLRLRWDALKWDTSPEWKKLLQFAADSRGVWSNADKAVNHYLDKLEQALDNPEV